jgi:hypothetical protein
MNVALFFLIVAIRPDAPLEGRYPGATGLLHCTFSESADLDFDGWPDRWTRRQGPGFPHYVKIFIAPEPTPAGDRCLRFEMDGGAAAAYAPPVGLEPGCDYVLEGWINAEGLDKDVAFLSLTVSGQRRQPVETFASEKLGRSPGWRKVRVGPISSGSEQGRQATIGLHVEPGSQADLRGAARFGDLWLGRLPRISLSADGGACLLADPRDAKVTCTVHGLAKPAATVRFDLYDVRGASLAGADLPLKTESHAPESTPSANSAPAETLTGTAQWQPPLPGIGFYRVRATLRGDDGLGHRRELPLVVIRPQPLPSRGQFGWSMARSGRSRLAASAEWILQAGVKWVKVPLGAGGQSDEKDAQPLGQFVQRLSSQGIQLVGVLDRPPDKATSPGPQSPSSSIAEWFGQDRKVWAPGLETLGTRFGGPVRWWQLGRDGEAGFVGDPRLAAKIDQIKAEFQRPGQDASLGVAWGWMDPAPETSGEKPSPLAFLSLSADPPLTPQELAAYLAAGPRTGAPRWVTLQALGKNEYSVEDRAIDLVQQMIAAKTAGAAAVFLADPLSTDHGLLDEDGLPGELFLPWRTTALALSDAKPAGSLVLAQGSANQVFLRGQDAAMAVWNPRPTRETLYLGPGVRQVDAWGRETPLAEAEGGQTVEVGPLPSLVVGIDRRVAQWQLGLSLAGNRIPGALGQRHSTELAWNNPFNEGVEGTVRLLAPDGWNVDPQEIVFRMAGGESLRRTLDIAVPVRTPSGLHLLRADFEVRADRSLRFTVYRPIHVGPDDLRIEVETQLNRQGELEVQQRLVNETDRPVRFDCQLLTPDRRRLTVQAACPAGGLDVQTYRLADGKELLGKALWLLTQETGGPRALNYRIVAEP